MAFYATNKQTTPQLPFSLAASLKTWLGSDGSLLQRTAGVAFGIRVASAAVVYISQVVLARWMGGFEFGVYIYVWTWVLLLGDIIHLGLPLAAQRFIPEYNTLKSHDRLRGFIIGARRLAFLCASVVALCLAAAIYRLQSAFHQYEIVPFYFACLALPFFALSIMLDGVARSYNWMALALAPHYLWRPILILILMVVFYLAGFAATATTAMVAVATATIAMSLVQLVLINRRLAGRIEAGPRHYEVKAWLGTSLPLIVVASFYTVLTYTDLLVLQQFRPPEEVAVYYAAARTLLLVAFVYFSVGAAVTHRFTAYFIAGDREGLADLVAHAVRWTFWPSLVATILILALGRPLLMLFGAGFVDGYPLMFILGIGLLARASVGPAERLLNMMGHQRACALVYAGAFATNLFLCIILVPRFGILGAAIAVSTAMLFETAALFVTTKWRLDLHIFVFGNKR